MSLYAIVLQLKTKAPKAMYNARSLKKHGLKGLQASSLNITVTDLNNGLGDGWPQIPQSLCKRALNDVFSADFFFLDN